MAARTLIMLLLGLVWLLAAPSSRAADYFLTIGGGYDATGNQVSLERNVLFLESTLSAARPDQPAHEVYFANGRSERRDLQYRDPDFRTTCPPARRMLAEIFGDESDMDLVYRPHEIVSVTGAADLNLLRRRFRDLGRELKAGDRLVVYFTGHGGEASQYGGGYEYGYGMEDYEYSYRQNREYNRYDTSLYFWDHESVSASEFTKWLDRLPEDVTVLLVMVQCYSGGFSHTIFHQANADLGLATRLRCGFFSQVHDRMAAGCTPDIDEADYQEYSTFFWAALGGRTRTGEPVTSADYNGDGQVSFAEAHAYAVIESNTIDIPVRTTGALLRQYSTTGEDKSDAESDESAAPLGRLFGLLAGSDEARAALVKLDGSLARLIARARPDEKAVLEQLTNRLELKENVTVESIRKRLEQNERQTKRLDMRLAGAARAYAQAQTRIQEEIREVWPELHADYAPLAISLASDRADEFVAHVEKLPAYQALRRASERQEKLAEERLNLSRTDAKLQRLLRACEDVVLAANLPHVATPEVVARYEQLLALEEATLVPPAEAVAAVAGPDAGMPPEPVVP